MTVWDKLVILHSASFCSASYRYVACNTVVFFHASQPGVQASGLYDHWSMLVTGELKG